MFDNIEKIKNKVSMSTLIEKTGLKCLNPEADTDQIFVTENDINRPALQLTGFFDHFDHKRIQLIGRVEYTYIHQVYKDEGASMIEKMFMLKIPGIVYCRNLQPSKEIVELGKKYGVPVLSTECDTSTFMAKLIHALNDALAPKISIHGVLVDVYGEGVLIIGESGIGKSEAALELIKRGHRLVSDDVVELRIVDDDILMGSAPDITRYFIELRGIGIVDVRSLFGVNSVKDYQQVNLAIKLEEWQRDRDYDRLGIEDTYTEFLGKKIVCNSIPVRPGRNLAVIIEVAAVNFRQKQQGYNAAQELYRRVTGNIQKKMEDKNQI